MITHANLTICIRYLYIVYCMKLTHKQEDRMHLIFGISVIATAWSLYYWRYGDPISQIATWDFFNPENWFGICELCRYARILTYPIVLLSWIALIRKDANIAVYTLVLSWLTIILEAYHYGLQKIDIATSEVCTLANPCEALSVNYFWFVTIPFLCLLAAVGIFVASLCIISKKNI